MGAECAVCADRVCGSPWARAAAGLAPIAIAAIRTAARTPRRTCGALWGAVRDAGQAPLRGWIGRRAITGAWRVICGGVRAGAETVDQRVDLQAFRSVRQPRSIEGWLMERLLK